MPGFILDDGVLALMAPKGLYLFAISHFISLHSPTHIHYNIQVSSLGSLATAAPIWDMLNAEKLVWDLYDLLLFLFVFLCFCIIIYVCYHLILINVNYTTENIAKVLTKNLVLEKQLKILVLEKQLIEL